MDATPGSSSKTLSVEQLMEQYVDGNPEAFDELYRQVSPRILGYLIRLTRDPVRAEDLLQLTFTKVHRARESYLRGAPLLPWLLAIARRCFYDERRFAKNRPEDLSFNGMLPEPKQEQVGLAPDMAEALERALNQLPEAYREAIELTKITGLSIAEAAGVLGATETAVKLRVHRGYNLLRQSLQQFRRT